MLNRLKAWHDKKRSQMSNGLLMLYFKTIRDQCKWQGREIDTLLDYINELEYRRIRYRL